MKKLSDGKTVKSGETPSNTLDPINLAIAQTQKATDEIWQVLGDLAESEIGQNNCTDNAITLSDNRAFEAGTNWATFRSGIQGGDGMGFTVNAVDDICFECLGIMPDDDSTCPLGLNGYVVTWSRYPTETYQYPSKQSEQQIHGMDPVRICAETSQEIFEAVGWQDVLEEMESFCEYFFHFLTVYDRTH